jgi:hypothetical protein
MFLRQTRTFRGEYVAAQDFRETSERQNLAEKFPQICHAAVRTPLNLNAVCPALEPRLQRPAGIQEPRRSVSEMTPMAGVEGKPGGRF